MPHSSSTLFAMVEELLALEDKNLRSGLTDEERLRWIELSKTVLVAPPDLVERRRYFRVQADHQARLRSPCEDEPAVIRSVSGGGLFVQTPSVPPLGSDVDLEVVLPLESQKTIPLRGRVRWVSGGSDAPGGLPRGFGVCFLDLDDVQRHAILDLLRDCLLSQVRTTVQNYRFFFEHSPDLAILLDGQNRVLDCNEKARVWLGLAGERILNRSLLTLFDGTCLELLSTSIEEAHRSGMGRCEVQICGPDSATPSTIELLATPLRATDIALGVLIVGRDVSERVKMEEQTRTLERRLYQADKLACLGQISASIAHDINNPLAWVLSNMALLVEYAQPLQNAISVALQTDAYPLDSPDASDLAEIQRNLDEVVRESVVGVRRIRDIIRDLRTFSRVDFQQEDEVDVNEALDVTIRIVRNQIQHRAHVVREYSEVPVTYIHFGKLSQVFLNLITNAVKCFQTAEVEKNEITVRTWEASGFIRVAIADNGPGIPSELQEKVFEPFFTSGAEGGTGLGLTIARDATRSFGGEIELRSRSGVGTEFIVSIPIRRRPSKRPTAPRFVAKAPSRFKVLVVDDEPVLLKSYERFLRRRFDVVVAVSADDALLALMQGEFDVVLCDVMLPNRNGLWLYQEARRSRPGIETKFVFMSGAPFGEQEKTTLEGLPNLVIEKPLDTTQVEEILLDFVAQRTACGD